MSSRRITSRRLSIAVGILEHLENSYLLTEFDLNRPENDGISLIVKPLLTILSLRHTASAIPSTTPVCIVSIGVPRWPSGLWVSIPIARYMIHPRPPVIRLPPRAAMIILLAHSRSVCHRHSRFQSLRLSRHPQLSSRKEIKGEFVYLTVIVFKCMTELGPPYSAILIWPSGPFLALSTLIEYVLVCTFPSLPFQDAILSQLLAVQL